MAGGVRRSVFFSSAIGVVCAPAAIAQSSGADVYQRTCRACHENPDGRTPSVEALRGMTAARILRTLDFGSMMTVAYPLPRDEREAVAAFLGKAGPEPEPSPAAFCTDRRVSLDLAARTWNGWSPTSDNTRFVPNAVSGIAAADVPALRLKWAFGFAGDISAFAQPTVIGDHIFVGSAGGVVHALSAASGCLRWIFQAAGPIRSSIVAAPIDGGHVLLFGDLTGLVLRARRRHRKAAVEETTRGTRGRAPQRAAGGTRRARDHPRGVVGGNARAQHRVCLLHVSWQPDRVAHSRRLGSVEDVHGSDAGAAHRQGRIGGRYAWTVRYRHLGNTDARSQTPAAVRRDRQQLLASRHVAQRRGGGRRSRHRADPVVDAGPCERRLQLRVFDDAPRSTVPRGKRSGPRLRIASDSRDHGPWA